MNRTLVVVVFAVLCTLIRPVLAAEDATEPERKTADRLTPETADIEEFRLIHADSMTLTRQKDEPQVFKGSVDIIMIDKDAQEMRIKAEKITIYYEQTEKKVQKIEAEGDVEIRRLGTVATTDLAVYHGDKNIIELLIDPYVKDARGELRAQKITIFADSDRVVAEGSVSGTVYPEAVERAPTR
jgi:lipopolysaccharide transport protein LptA